MALRKLSGGRWIVSRSSNWKVDVAVESAYHVLVAQQRAHRQQIREEQETRL